VRAEPLSFFGLVITLTFWYAGMSFSSIIFILLLTKLLYFYYFLFPLFICPVHQGVSFVSCNILNLFFSSKIIYWSRNDILVTEKVGFGFQISSGGFVFCFSSTFLWFRLWAVNDWVYLSYSLPILTTVTNFNF